MNKEEITKEVLKSAIKEEETLFLDCETAFEIAKKCKVKPIEVGKACNAQKVKIRKCQLGCF